MVVDASNDPGAIRVALEVGPKGKRVVAVAPDWPGLSRGAKSEEQAIATLLTYLPRYARVAELAGLEWEFAKVNDPEILERYPGTGSTDFWGISFGFSSIDRGELPDEALDRHLSLMRGCWSFFDAVRARVSSELRKGPRGGGRDRDEIVRHVVANEMGWAPKPELPGWTGELPTEAGLAAHRDAYCEAIRDLHAEGKPAGKWPLSYLIRHTAYHTMDHASEMEDKDLTAGPA
jgi:hypothetical protein